MIGKIAIQNFKRFKDSTEFSLRPEGVTFLAGGNNSGKSTLLQALAVWDFARSAVEINKGPAALLSGAPSQAVGVSAEEFSPIALPNLKHLFSDLRTFTGKSGDGYPLRIRCDWPTIAEPPGDRHLEFSLAFSNDRLFLKRTASNLADGDRVPRMAYLPPFAGMGAREERMSQASRKRWIGAVWRARSFAICSMTTGSKTPTNATEPRAQEARHPRPRLPNFGGLTRGNSFC